MRKKLISFILVVTFLVSGLSVLAVDEEVGVIIDENFDVWETNTHYAVKEGNQTDNSKWIYNGNVSNFELKKVENDAEYGIKNSCYIYKMFDEPVSGIVEMTYDVKFSKFIKGGVEGTNRGKVYFIADMLDLEGNPVENVKDIDVWLFNGWTGIFTRFESEYRRDNIYFDASYMTDEMTIKVAADTVNSALAISIKNASGEWDTVEKTIANYKIKSIKGVKFEMYGNNEGFVYYDNILVKNNVPLKVLNTSITDQSVNVNVGLDKIDIDFNRTITSAEGIKLEKYTGENVFEKTVSTTLTSVGKMVTLNINENLESLSNYVLTIPAGVAAENGFVLESDYAVNFRTEMVNPLNIENAQFSAGQFVADISSSNQSSVNAEAVLIIYEVVNGIKRYVREISEDITVNNTYVYNKTISDLPENYEVSLLLFDENSNPLALSKSFNKDGQVEDISPVVSSDKQDVDYVNGVVTVEGNIGTLSYVHKVIDVKTNNNEIIYKGQTMTNENGSYSFKFVPPSDIVCDKYYITINGTEMNQSLSDEIEVDYSSFNCSITKPQIKGKLLGGELIEADYLFESVIGEDEGNSVYEWNVAQNEQGPWNTITGGKSYLVSSEDEYKYIKVSVKPFSKLGLSQGDAKESDPVYILSKPIASNVSIGGSAKPGETLTGKYSYYHKGGLRQLESQYKWLIASTKDGDYTETGNGLSYVVKSSDVGKYIKFSVIPGCDGEPHTGDATESSAIYVESRVSGDSGNSSSRDSSSIGYVPGPVVPPTPIEIKPEEIKLCFDDIEEHWARNCIEKLYDKGIVKGKTDNSFEPESNVTRAEFTAMIMRVLGIGQGEYVRMFEDVQKTDWYSGYIQSAVTNGIVSGDGRKFRPNDGITREEMAVICVNALEQKMQIEESNEFNVTDENDISEWAIESIKKAYKANIIVGFYDGSFLPKGNAKRAEAAAVMVRLLNNIEKGVE